MKAFTTVETYTERTRLDRRLSDLNDRLETLRELPEDGADLECWVAGSELTCAVPEDLRSVSEVLRAMELAQGALEELDRAAALVQDRWRQVEGQLSLLGSGVAGKTEEAA